MVPPVPVFDRVPTEILEQIAQFLDGPSLLASLQVDNRWYTTLQPLTWSRLSFRQWNHASFPVIRNTDLQQDTHGFPGVETTAVSEEDDSSNDRRPRLLSRIRHLEWWTNDSCSFSLKYPNNWVYPVFSTTLTPSEALMERAFSTFGINRNSIFSHFQDWCYCGRKGYSPPSQCRPEMPIDQLTRLLTEGKIPNLTSLSLRFGPRLELDMLSSLKDLPKTLKTLRLVSWDYSTSQIEIKDLFPVLEGLDELELKGYWFSPGTPLGRRVTGQDDQVHVEQVQQEYQQLIRQLQEQQQQEPPSQQVDRKQQRRGYKPWKVKRLSVKFEGLYLVGFCPDLEELHMDFFVPFVRFYYQVRGAGRTISFTPLQECGRKLKVLKLWRVSGMEQCLDLVETWSWFENLTDLSYMVTDLDHFRFLCEFQQRRQSNTHEQEPGQDQNDGGDPNTISTAINHYISTTTEDDSDFYYALPHLQHLEIRGARLCSAKAETFSRYLRIFLMTRKRLLTFKVKTHSIEMGHLFSSSSEDSKINDKGTQSSLSRPWACTRLQILHLLLHYPDDPDEAPPIITRDYKGARPRFSQEEECAMWRPVYERIGALSDLRSLTLVSSGFQKGPDSGILQWSQDRNSNTTSTPSNFDNSDSTIIVGSLDNLMYRESRLRRLRFLNFQVEEEDQRPRSEWTRQELALVVLQLPSLELLDLKPLEPSYVEDALSWLRESSAGDGSR